MKSETKKQPKTKVKLNALEEVETVNNKLHELSDDELAEVTGGAMIVNYNMAAINTLTQLSKNQGSLAKSLAKLSSGMKINSAADDPSGYQISERMRAQVRALDIIENNKAENDEY